MHGGSWAEDCTAPEAPACCLTSCQPVKLLPLCNSLTPAPLSFLAPLASRSPVGHYCSGGVKTACSAGSFNPLLGQGSNAACTLCSADAANAGYTSNEGEAECTVPLVDIACLDESEGREYDAASQTCLACPAGTYRPTTDDPMSCVAW
jgi:hypothetical protein